MYLLSWSGFITALAVVIIVARKNLPLALLLGTLILGFFTLPILTVFKTLFTTVIDPSIITLALAVGLIPMIGGVMKDSGQMDNLVNNLRIGKKGIMALSPALMGLLPMPGGALFSAPVLEKAGKDIAEDLKVSVNIWFRHLLILIYPLSSDLIASAKIAGMNLYTVILHFIPTLALALALGYFFFIRKIRGSLSYSGSFSLKKLLLPLAIILVAPVIDFAFKTFFFLPIKEIATLLGVATAFVLALWLSPANIDLKKTFKKMKPWNFALIIFGMFMFLNIFTASGIAVLIARIPLSPVVLCVVAGFIVAAATGRVLLPSSIIYPIYLATSVISPVKFAIIYTSIFFGYVISPVHPCVAVTCEYFKSPVKDMIRLLAIPVGIIFVAALLCAIFLG